MAYGVDASVQGMEPPNAKAMPDRAVTEAKRPQLPPRDDPVLALR